jgi:prepilin-type N-terminal cleavage/methylation domain-containing protein
MKTSIKNHRSRGFTLIELLVVISIIAIIAALAFPGFAAIIRKARMASQASNGRQIYLAMRNYAGETSHNGQFPTYGDPDDANTIVASSNQAFELLLPRYVDNKSVFANKNSAWCRPVAQSPGTADKVLPGESDWAYVRGLRDTSRSNWPILANAFAQGSTTYVADPGKRGGVWQGTDAVVVWAGGNAEVVQTRDQGGAFFVKRADKPSSNAFEKEGDWLNGDEVQVLHPES